MNLTCLFARFFPPCPSRTIQCLFGLMMFSLYSEHSILYCIYCISLSFLDTNKPFFNQIDPYTKGQKFSTPAQCFPAVVSPSACAILCLTQPSCQAVSYSQGSQECCVNTTPFNIIADPDVDIWIRGDPDTYINVV